MIHGETYNMIVNSLWLAEGLPQESRRGDFHRKSSLSKIFPISTVETGSLVSRLKRPLSIHSNLVKSKLRKAMLAKNSAGFKECSTKTVIQRYLSNDLQNHHKPLRCATSQSLDP
jgi:hypothetical protein